MIARRGLVGALALIATGARAAVRRRRVFDVATFGAKGDGKTLDTAAIQAAIDAAAPVGGRVLLGGRRSYLTAPIALRGGIDFHIARGAVLLVSVRPEDYPAGDTGTLNVAGINAHGAVLHAKGAHGLTISGGGVIDGRSPEFMERYDAADEWWIPKAFRPRLVVLEDCADLVIRDVALRRAPSWTVHLIGCRRVLVDGVTIANQLDVPNCDGIDPDHCQDVEIRNCRITCGDDAIVIKTTAGYPHYGPSRGIRVHDCVLETQDSGLKIGTETTQDIHDVVFERCRIVTGCRGICIQSRDQGVVHDITFRAITFVARYHSAPWWGRGEAISFTSIPRRPGVVPGGIRDIRVEDVRGTAENSVRIEALGGGTVSDVALRRVAVTLGRTTRYPGGVYDNRPTTAVDPIERSATHGISVRNAARVTLDDVAIAWAPRPPADFGSALRAENAPDLKLVNFRGEAAHPDRDPARLIR